MPHTGKGIYANYDRGQVEKAASAVREGLSLRGASKKFGIPRSTISDRVTGKVSSESTLGRPPVFPMEVEKEIAETAKTAADKGIGLSKSQLLVRTGKLAARMNIKTPFKSKPGHSWWEGFKKRNAGITLRQPEPLSSNRSRMMNPVVVGRYLIDLKHIIDKYNLNATSIWNCDETGINMLHKPTKVCARVGAKNVPGRVGNSRTQVTFLPCINAAGECMPPMIVVKGKTKRCLSSYEVKDGPSNAIWTYQQKAWMDDVLGASWFDEIFLAHCGPRRPQLLILDSHHSHETLDILERAKENNIMVLALPPHTTHYLCPLDRAVFSPLQRHYNAACSEYMTESTTNVVDRQSMPKLIKTAAQAAFTRSNIVSGFESTGIFNWDPLRIPAVAFSPSICSDEKGAIYAEKDLVRPDDTHPLQWVMRSIQQVEPVEVSAEISMEAIVPERNGLPEVSDVQEVADVPSSEGINDFEMILSEDNFVTFVAMDDLGPADEPSFLAADNMWNAELRSIFDTPPPTREPSAQNHEKAKKCITTHRLLTSEEIINGKQIEKEQKLKAEAVKKMRKEHRDLKRKLKESQKK